MPTIRVDIGRASALLEALANRAPRALERGVKSFLLRAKPIMVEATNTARPANPARKGTGAFNTGNYRQRWKATLTRTEGLPGALISNDTPYAGVIEYGRRAGARAPPVKVLEPWVRRKLGIPYKQARSVAYLISRAIKRRGLRPRYVLTSRATSFKLERAFKEEVTRALIDVAKGLT